MAPPSIATSRAFSNYTEKTREVAIGCTVGGDGVKVKLSYYYHNNATQNVTIHTDEKM